MFTPVVIEQLPAQIVIVGQADELDLPSYLPGPCPECGQAANIWNPATGHYECTFCSWEGKP